MKLIRLSAIILLLVLISGVHNVYGQLYSYKNLTHRNGLPLTTTWAIKEKPDGGILIGTQGAGLVEYDGYTFHDVIAADQDKLHHVTGIELLNNEIFFASKFKGLFRINSSGKVRNVFMQEKIGDYIDVVAYNNCLLIIAQRAIYNYDLTTKTAEKINPQLFETNLHIYQKIATPRGLIFLTNQGNFMYTPERKFMSLGDFFKTGNKEVGTMTFGYYKNDSLHLFDKTIENGLIAILNQQAFNGKIKTLPKVRGGSIPVIVEAVYNSKKDCFAFFGKNGEIFEETDCSLKKVPLNTQQRNISLKKVLCDYNGDYWFTSDLAGVFKIGLQPFTKVELQHEFEDRQISFVNQTAKGSIIFSNFHHTTYSGNPYVEDVKKHDLEFLCSAIMNGKSYFGGRSGVYEYLENKNEFSPVHLPFLPADKQIQFMGYQAPFLWIGVYGDGLYKLDSHFKLIKHYKNEKHVPLVIYTGQFSNDGNELFLGTSNGIVKLAITSEEFSKVDNHEFGYYCGLSVKDIFGTNWFTLESGLIGISKQGEIFTLSSPSLFPSYLFYTLNTDNYGNLIIGTNKGLNLIQVNEQGKVLRQYNFNSGTDFEGYETHMRASFQENNAALVGTLEGMYKLDFELMLDLPVPKKPIIVLKSDVDNYESSIISFRFLSKNPKMKTVLYTYRILHHTNKWEPLSGINEASISNLRSGFYVIEVRATYDGLSYSEIARFPVTIKLPLLRGNLLIISLILIVIVLNVIFYVRSKKNETFELFYSEEVYSTQKYAQTLILFGLISHIAANEIAPFISATFHVNHLMVGLTAFLLFCGFIGVRYFGKNGSDRTSQTIITLCFSVIMLFNIYSMYMTSLHPFYGFSVLLIGSVAPLIFEKTKAILLYAVVFLGINITVILSSPGLNYDKYLLIIPVVISGLLAVFMNLIRHDSVHQLAFISSIINKSNVLALAMDQDGRLKYVSKNIAKYINIQSKDLIDKPISIMNDYLPTESSRKIDLKTEFKDGKRFLSPILNVHHEVSWFEWSCKEFSKDVKVLIGQDITEKINLQNTYEILVENAEDLIYQVDIDGNFQFLNNRFNDYLMQEKDSLLGTNVSELIPEEYREVVVDFYKNQLKSHKKVSYFEFPIIDSKQQLQWFGQYATLLYAIGDSSTVVGFLVVGRNITEKIKKDSLIAAQSADITASINYAKRIQLNLLPSSEKIEHFFSESFMIYKPKDIVSGDFYWCNQLGDYTIVAVGDGTGHGVPGAFMSILGINLLNSIIMEKHIFDPGRILDELDIKLKHMLSEGNQQKINDGIEMTICIYNERSKTLEYACAGSKLMLHDGKSFSIRKGDSKHIGDEHPNFQGYVSHHQPINNETTIYMFTDGFYDQFGGFQQKKYSIRRLLELLMQNISLPLKTQQEIIIEEFESWKSTTEQTDDVTIIGLRINEKN